MIYNDYSDYNINDIYIYIYIYIYMCVCGGVCVCVHVLYQSISIVII